MTARPLLFAVLVGFAACDGAASNMGTDWADAGGDAGSARPADAGQTEQADAAVAPLDAGVPPVDAGGAGHDAGFGLGDAGSDAGSGAGSDAGLGGHDAGSPVLVLVGYGARRVRSLDGLTWTDLQQLTPTGGDDENLFRGVTFGGGLFVAVGGSSHGFTMTSRDGITWENENRAAGAWIGNVGYLQGQFVAAGGNGLRIRSTDSAKTWKDAAGYQDIHYRDLVVGLNMAVAVGHTYAGVGAICTTSDGTTWVTRVSTGATFNSVAFGHDTFVAVGNTGRLAYSFDGVSWVDVTTLQTTEGESVVFTGTEFIASMGAKSFRSSDGVTWSSLGASRAVHFYAFDHAFSLGWPATIVSSTNFTSWKTVYDLQGSGFTRFALGAVP